MNKFLALVITLCSFNVFAYEVSSLNGEWEITSDHQKGFTYEVSGLSESNSLATVSFTEKGVFVSLQCDVSKISDTELELACGDDVTVLTFTSDDTTSGDDAQHKGVIAERVH